jgi:hypothetical protein
MTETTRGPRLLSARVLLAFAAASSAAMIGISLAAADAPPVLAAGVPAGNH